MVSFERARLYTIFKGVKGGQEKSKPLSGLQDTTTKKEKKNESPFSFSQKPCRYCDRRFSWYRSRMCSGIGKIGM